MNGWTLVYDSFEPEHERLRETLCTLGNGYFATRGAAEEADANEIHYPGTYLAAGYDRLETEVAGRRIENEDLVNWPNWLCLTFRPEGGEWFDLEQVEIVNYRQELDLKAGVMRRQMRVRDRQGRETTLQTRRLVHMATRIWPRSRARSPRTTGRDESTSSRRWTDGSRMRESSGTARSVGIICSRWIRSGWARKRSSSGCRPVSRRFRWPRRHAPVRSLVRSAWPRSGRRPRRPATCNSASALTLRRSARFGSRRSSPSTRPTTVR